MCDKGHTGVPQEFLNHAMPGYLVALTSFSLDCQIKNDNSQHNNSHLVFMNQNYAYFILSDQQKSQYILCLPQNFSN